MDFKILAAIVSFIIVLIWILFPGLADILNLDQPEAIDVKVDNYEDVFGEDNTTGTNVTPVEQTEPTQTDTSGYRSDLPEFAVSQHVQEQKHPYLLFDQIGDTPGYKNRKSSPWNSWEEEIMSVADTALRKDFKKAWGGEENWVSRRAYYAENAALAYHLTKDKKYASKVKEALLNLDTGTVPSDPGMMSPEAIRAISLLHYCLAYDWIQPTLDSASDQIIRDKLARLASTVYLELNEEGTRRDFISFVDYHGQAYPIMGIAGVVLNDYTNPNGLALSSDPKEWRRVGTDYLFVNDELHSYGKPLMAFETDASGKDLLGAYKNYYIDDMVIWAQVYTRFYGKNFFEAYPLAKDVLISELWDSMPDKYSANFITNGNQKWTFHKGIANLLDENNRSYVLKINDIIERSNELKYTKTPFHLHYDTQLPESVLYLVYPDYSKSPRNNPPYTSRLNTDSVYQVFRENWDQDSDWLALIAFGKDIMTYTYRNTQHHDQMSFEYYAKGDLLLADAGEDRHSTNNYKGAYEVHHNTIAIENPRKTFAVAKWSDSTARGMFKGTESGLKTIADVNYTVQTPWMEIVSTKTSINRVIGSGSGSSMGLSSPITYERLVLYPEKDYFIILDRFASAETWTYRNIFRPASLSITPSGKSIGHVNGDLYLGGSSYNWQSLNYRKEYNTGITTNAFQWTTKNPFGDQVSLNVFTVPASEVRIIKQIGRVGGYDDTNEVYSPVVYFRSGPGTELYRATVLLPRYNYEAAAEPSEVPVEGNGNALKVTSQGYEDYVYTGNGPASFGPFRTDASVAFVRLESGQPVEYTLAGGTYLDYEGVELVAAGNSLQYLTVKVDGDKIDFEAEGPGNTEVKLGGLGPAREYNVERNGSAYGKWSKTDGQAVALTID